jgi:membrane-bound metal-dependent hydrolase YbcI (DUF457 family)
MPLPVSHGLLGASIVAAIHPHPRGRYYIPLLAGAGLANAADLDFALVFLLGSKGWHRGFSHSLIFALIVCLGFALSFGRHRLREALAYGLAFASHALLDYATTNAGGGVELLWPFSLGRMGLRWVGLSELPSRLPAAEVVESLLLECALFAPLLLSVMGVRRYLGKDAGARTTGF